MFENNIEKGLFTFYWEEAQKQNKNNQPETIQQHNNPVKNTASKRTKVKIEEKQPHSPKNQRRIKTKTMDLRPIQLHSVTLNEKQNRQYLLPNTLDISSKLAQSLKLQQEKSGLFKLRSNKQKQQTSCKLPLLKSTLSRQQSQCQLKHSSSQNLEKLTPKDLNASMKHLTIKIQEEHANQPQLQKAFCGKKARKMNTHRAKKQSVNQKLCRKFIMIDVGNTNKSPRQLPVISPRTLNKGAQKDSHTLQRLMLQRMQETNRYSTVINIGMSSCDEYNQRWLKRKEQFLNILTKNMSGPILRE